MILFYNNLDNIKIKKSKSTNLTNNLITYDLYKYLNENFNNFILLIFKIAKKFI
jgi:hypothetical protein